MTVKHFQLLQSSADKEVIRIDRSTLIKAGLLNVQPFRSRHHAGAEPISHIPTVCILSWGSGIGCKQFVFCLVAVCWFCRLSIDPARGTWSTVKGMRSTVKWTCDSRQFQTSNKCFLLGHLHRSNDQNTPSFASNCAVSSKNPNKFFVFKGLLPTKTRNVV